jgi:leucyl-tRNA synthetase
MSERRKPYPFDRVEPKWQSIWEKRRAFHASNPSEENFDPAKPKFYVLDMFPYPSGAGLHVGHPEGYTATDIIARYKRMRGFNVLHPMGWDAFGLPAEQYAIKTGQHPEITTRENVAKFKSQLKQIGFSYDWEREVNTTDPHYYKWTQWIFLQLYNSWFNPKKNKAEPIKTYRGDDPDSVRLAYVAEVPVNWCPELGTVLANEEVVDGKSDIGGFPVVRRPMRQWMLRITAYAERLVNELEELDWPESIKLLQRNWVGRSEGAEINFPVAGVADPGAAVSDRSYNITVFTTRPDTLYGATYMVVAPEHPLVDGLTSEDRKDVVEKYRAEISSKSDLERTDLAKEKSGVFTGTYAINPVTNEHIPVWIADYVLMGYGTGAIMAVPAHDERDLEFARKFNLPVREVVAAAPSPPSTITSGVAAAPSPPSTMTSGVAAAPSPPSTMTSGVAPLSHCFIGDGTAINSPIIEGLKTAEAKSKIIDWLEQHGHGRPDVRYKLRDWLFSRQRYWGEPFPIVWENGKHRALGENELPVVPPSLDDFKPTGTGEAPLAKAKDWIRYKSSSSASSASAVSSRPQNKKDKEEDAEGEEELLRETNTMPQWAGSCWYYLRFCDPQNDKRFVGEEAERYWMGGQKPGGVDLYVGGTEHAVLHLLYARFWHKVLFDLGYLSKPEPFQRLVNQGIILGEDNQKMSKSRGNIVGPDEVIEQYGADAFRCYEMFMGPLEQMKPWSMKGVEGISRFLARVWRLMMDENQAGEWILSDQIREIDVDKAQTKVVHATIKKVTGDIETLSFNTAIAQMMVFVNAFTNTPAKSLRAMRTLLVLLNPFAPHLTSELWETLNAKFSDARGEITEQAWPTYDEQFLVEDEVEIVLQVNGRVRDRIKVHLQATNDELEAAALTNDRVREFTSGKSVRKVVVIPKKLVNVVAD